jgi:hypothetical protein
MNLGLVNYTHDLIDIWDGCVKKSSQGTFLHLRSFIDYHGARFIDKSLLIYESQKCVGVLPAAIHPNDPLLLVSHPGITYGGLINFGSIKGKEMVDVFRLVMLHYKKLGFNKLVYKPVPIFYHKKISQDDIYALSTLGASQSKCSLSSLIDLRSVIKLKELRKRSLKLANSSRLSVSADIANLKEAWFIIENNLLSRHQAIPVHSFNEISLLFSRFPNNINLVTAHRENKVIAAIITFETETTIHTQYIGSNAEGRNFCAIDFLMDYLVEKGRAQQINWLDFGTSEGLSPGELNHNLYAFKFSFGGSSCLHLTYDLDL